jgi:hypothetical protein
MARTDFSIDDLEEITDRFDAILQTLQRTIRSMRRHQVGSILIHGQSTCNRYLPLLYEWARRCEVDAEVQIDAISKGRTPVQVYSKEYDDKHRKPERKKGGKK